LQQFQVPRMWDRGEHFEKKLIEVRIKEEQSNSELNVKAIFLANVEQNPKFCPNFGN